MSPIDVAFERQTAASVLMVRPASFASNPETAESNRFQTVHTSLPSTSEQALVEFDGVVTQLRAHTIEVVVFDDTPVPRKPDAIFPNNWVSLHADGTVVLYPMLAENRRGERRRDIVDALSDRHGFEVTGTIDLSHRELNGKFLEGTGSMVLDRCNRIAYACLSPRTDIDVLGEFAERLGYRVVTFEAFAFDAPIYHTNVVMAVGQHFAVVCMEALRPEHQDRVRRSLQSTGHEIIEITFAQMSAFAGNLLELEARTGKLIALSATAGRSLSTAQRSRLERFGGKMLPLEIPTIEKLGGGSLRCMLAEIHLPRQRR
jgi:hypothetical protein